MSFVYLAEQQGGQETAARYHFICDLSRIGRGGGLSVFQTLRTKCDLSTLVHCLKLE
jgi:hypothetical protein